MMAHRSSSLTLLPVVAGLALVAHAGCSGPPDESLPIAEIAGRPIPLGEFQPVLERYASDGDFSDVVKSRLLDQFVEKRVLLEEANRRGIHVQEGRVDRALADLGGDPDADRREEIRTTLQVQQLMRLVLEETAPVTPEEEESYYREHADEFHQSAHLDVRQILLADAATAAEVHGSVIQEPERFAAIAGEQSTSPDRGRSLTYAVDALPGEVASVLQEVKPGGISPVIEAAGYFWIFLVEGVHEARSLPLEEARPEIRSLLQQEKGAGAMTRLLADLKGRLGVRLHPENLPFRYVEEGSA
ncbi:MAG: peptidylprolyl isomerase [Acidobacteriota bacterium]|jgi:parvulin-like peptidyl-prolyl isomerase